MSSGKKKRQQNRAQAAHPHSHAHAQEPDFDSLDPMLVLERGLRYLRRIKGPVAIEDLEHAPEALETLSTAEVQKAMNALNDDPKALAQEIAYEALTSDDPEEVAELVEQALSIDAQCVDAMTAAAIQADSAEQRLEGLREAATLASGQLGTPAPPGAVWTLVDAGPYLRAKRALADALYAESRFADAIPQFEDVLAIDTADYGNARMYLLASCLASGDMEKARNLLPLLSDAGPELEFIGSWARILERFLSGDKEQAAALLEQAAVRNRHVQGYLVREELPPVPEGEAKPGSIPEAALCVYTVGPAWTAHPDAIEWLKENPH